MADFLLSWPLASRNEGGYANDPRDPGKETYRGISIRFWPDWQGWDFVHLAIKHLQIDSTLANPSDVVNMGGFAVKASDAWLKITYLLISNQVLDEHVQSFYKLHFWDVLNLDNEPDQSIADLAFDAAVNKGAAKEKKALEQSRNEADEIV